MYRNNGKQPLYVVKRRDREIYHCGSFSNATPKLYWIGHAKTACKKLNVALERYKVGHTPAVSFEDWRSVNKFRMDMEDRAARIAYNEYLDYWEGGPWIVAEMQLVATEIACD